MELTKAEKLILYMSCDLHEAARVKNSVVQIFLKTALADGQPWAIEQKYSGIFGAEDASNNLKGEVYNIVHLWSLIEDTYTRLTTGELSDLEMGLGRAIPHFIGFDHNNEIEHYVTAHFIVEHMDQFQSLRSKVINNHMPVLANYRKMLQKWKSEQWDDGRMIIPVEHLKLVLNHPVSV